MVHDATHSDNDRKSLLRSNMQRYAHFFLVCTVYTKNEHDAPRSSVPSRRAGAARRSATDLRLGGLARRCGGAAAWRRNYHIFILYFRFTIKHFPISDIETKVSYLFT